MLNFSIISAIFRKDMRNYLGNPTGYVFITLFIMATGGAAFVNEEFFSRNLADLATLNRGITMLLALFVPAITMNAWAEERRTGTDELLLTLPVRDGEVVLGKYFGIVGMYTLALGLTGVGHIALLSFLGEPDAGLMFSTFLGYWLVGALFAAVGLVGSMLAKNSTVAFILGAVACAGLVYTGVAPGFAAIFGIVLCGALGALLFFASTGKASGAGWVGFGVGLAMTSMWQSNRIYAWFSDNLLGFDLATTFEELFGALSVDDHFASFGEGVIRLGDMIYFVGGITVLLYLCTALVGRRHW